MSDEKAAGPAATADKSQNSNKTFQERFNEALEGWRKEGCHRISSDTGTKLCGAAPHRAKMLPVDADGNVSMVVDCASGHSDVWKFKVAEAEMKDELARQQSAAVRAAEDAGKVARDPMKATLKITMDLKTQAISIDQWVPTPGMGIQLAGILMSHFFAQIQQAGAADQSGLALPPEKKLIDPKTGKPIVFS